MVLNFLGQMVIEMGGDTKFPRLVTKSTAAVQGMITIVLDGALSDIPIRISDDLRQCRSYDWYEGRKGLQG